MKGLITNIQRFCVHDGPGIRTTIFFKGCPLSCIWCQNPEAIKASRNICFFQTDCIRCMKCVETCIPGCFEFKGEIIFRSKNCNTCGDCIKICSANALKWSAYEISIENIISEINNDKIYFDLSGGGVTFSGGEPLFQKEFILELAKELKQRGIHIAIDTSGYFSTDTIYEIEQLIDLFLYDIKFIDEELHIKYTGKSNSVILDNFKILCELNKKIIVRVPVIPGITDTDSNLLKVENYVRSIKTDIEIDFIPFNRLSVEKYKMLGIDVNSKLIDLM